MVHNLSLFKTAFLVDWVRDHSDVWTLMDMLGQILLEVTLFVPLKTLRLEPVIEHSCHIEGALSVADAGVAPVF